MMNNNPFFTNKLQRSNQLHQNQVRQNQARSSPKVISVPVHFISSEQPTMSKASAALKIQRLFRGFLVRKSVKKIASIRNEVSEIERRIDDIEVADLIRRDTKERLRVNETLMSLLFKLDSIRGFDCGVRELRKAVTKKAIAIQEKVDSIANQTLDSSISSEIKVDNNVCSSTSEQSGSDNLQAVVDDGDIKEGVEVETNPTNDLSEENKPVEACSMAKLMADNEKMMKLMMQISERNEMQTRMINSLSRRVEQLEKAFMAENMRRKKKTRVALRNV